MKRHMHCAVILAAAAADYNEVQVSRIVSPSNNMQEGRLRAERAREGGTGMELDLTCR